MDVLHTSIKWFDSKADALTWFNQHDWAGDYSDSQEEQKEFVEKAKAMLAER